MSEPVVRVTIEDLVDGGTETIEVPAGDYYLLTTNPCWEAVVQAYPKAGTHVITVKGIRQR